MSAYAIYTRQSRVRHDVTLSSCDVQFQICRDYADAVLPRGITWCETRYDDPGQSGENFDRPALKAMLAEIEKGTISPIASTDCPAACAIPFSSSTAFRGIRSN